MTTSLKRRSFRIGEKMKNQIEKIQYLPSLLALVFSGAFFFLMMIPHSQYELLNEMSTLAGSAETLNALVIVPAIMTVFVIIFNCFVCALALLSLFMSFFYNFHFVSNGILVTSTISFLLQSVYFFVGINGVLANGERIISIGNIIIYVLYFIFMVALFVLHHKLISVPYHEIKLEAGKHISEYDTELETPENVETNEENTAMEETEKNEPDLQMTVLNMLQKGKISPEEAKKLLSEIQEEKKDED